MERIGIRVYPRPRHWKRSGLALLALVALVAGCGGGGKPKAPAAATQRVTGAAFSFAAPQGWRSTRTSQVVTATPGKGPILVSVTVVSLLKRYRPALFIPAAAELNRITAALAAKLHGRLAAQRTIVVSGQRVRQYEVAYRRAGIDLTDQVTYVLRGKSEYYLLCRWPSGTSEPSACGLLTASFRLG